MDQVPVARLVAHGLTQLLQRPGRCRMLGYIEVQQSTRAVVDHHKYVEHAKCRRDGHEEAFPGGRRSSKSTSCITSTEKPGSPVPRHRRGGAYTPRSLYCASWRRKNRFSAS